MCKLSKSHAPYLKSGKQPARQPWYQGASCPISLCPIRCLPRNTQYSSMVHRLLITPNRCNNFRCASLFRVVPLVLSLKFSACIVWCAKSTFANLPHPHLAAIRFSIFTNHPTVVCHFLHSDCMLLVRIAMYKAINAAAMANAKQDGQCTM